jgi:hypothetical protein
MRGGSSVFVLLSALAFCPAPACAFSDEATGFAISAPEPFVVQPVPHRSVDVGVGVTSTTGFPNTSGSDYLCQAGYKATSSNAGLTQDDINRLVDGQNWVAIARRSFETLFSIDHEERFTLDGFRGIEFQGVPKRGPGANEARVFISMVESVKGRVTMVCSTSGPDHPKAVSDFRAIRSTIKLPH